MAEQPLVYKMLEKENLLFFIAILIFLSAITYIFIDIKTSVDHILVGIIFLIGGFAVRSFKRSQTIQS